MGESQLRWSTLLNSDACQPWKYSAYILQAQVGGSCQVDSKHRTACLHVSHMLMCKLHWRQIYIVNLPMQCIMDEKNMVMLQIHWSVMNIWWAIHYWCVLRYMVHNTWRQTNPVWWGLSLFSYRLPRPHTQAFFNTHTHTHKPTTHSVWH